MAKKDEAKKTQGFTSIQEIRKQRLQDAYELYRSAVEECKKKGFFQTSKNGYEQVRPAYTVMQEMLTEIKELEQMDGPVKPPEQSKKAREHQAKMDLKPKTNFDLE